MGKRKAYILILFLLVLCCMLGTKSYALNTKTGQINSGEGNNIWREIKGGVSLSSSGAEVGALRINGIVRKENGAEGMEFTAQEDGKTKTYLIITGNGKRLFVASQSGYVRNDGNNTVSQKNTIKMIDTRGLTLWEYSGVSLGVDMVSLSDNGKHVLFVKKEPEGCDSFDNDNCWEIPVLVDGISGRTLIEFNKMDEVIRLRIHKNGKYGYILGIAWTFFDVERKKIVKIRNNDKYFSHKYRITINESGDIIQRCGPNQIKKKNINEF